MPLRSDPTLWFNLPGVVAAYQPVMAPGPLLARYNMAHGGDNRYKAVDGTAPSWAWKNGWIFDGTSQYLNTRWIPPTTTSLSMVVRFNDYTTGDDTVIGVYEDAGGLRTFNIPRNGTSSNFRNGGQYIYTGINYSQAIYAIAGINFYINGLPIIFSTSTAWSGVAYSQPVYIGANAYNAGTPTNYFDGNIQAAAIYARTLSAAEVWNVSRQLTYCDVNPDWSVWGKRRKWFYAPE